MMYGHPLLTSVDSCLQWAQQTKKAQGLSRLCPENLVYTSIQDRKYHKKKNKETSCVKLQDCIPSCSHAFYLYSWNYQ